MKTIIPEGSGFCPGVVSAEKRLLELRKNFNGKIYISGMFIHNKEYEKYLKSLDIVTFEDYDNIINKNIANKNNNTTDDSIFVISTHGIDKNIEEKLNERFKVFDLTCPKVKNVQKIIESNQDYFAVITGKEDHPETIGLKSYSLNNIVVSDIKILNEKKFNDSIANKKVLLISQTTAEEYLYINTFNYLENLLNKNIIKELKNFNTICPSIINRENNAIDLLQKLNIKAIVIGDRLSSNSQRLFNKLKKINNDVFFIEKKSDLENILNNIKNDKEIIVVSSSSTPSFIEKEIIDFLAKI